jgi:hypothetical protein
MYISKILNKYGINNMKVFIYVHTTKLKTIAGSKFYSIDSKIIECKLATLNI